MNRRKRTFNYLKQHLTSRFAGKLTLHFVWADGEADQYLEVLAEKKTVAVVFTEDSDLAIYPGVTVRFFSLCVSTEL
jgi:hypothetical protein